MAQVAKILPCGRQAPTNRAQQHHGYIDGLVTQGARTSTALIHAWNNPAYTAVYWSKILIQYKDVILTNIGKPTVKIRWS